MLLPSQIHVEKQHHFAGHSAGVFALAPGISPHTVLSGGGDGVIAEWDLMGDGHAKGIARVPGNIFSLCTLPDRHLILAGDLHGGLHSIDTRTNTEVNRFAWDGGAIYAIARLQEEVVALCSGTGNLILRNIAAHNTIKVIQVSDQALRGIHLHPDGKRLAIASSDHKIHVLRVDDLSSIAVLDPVHGHNNSVFTVRWSLDGRYLVSGSRDAQLKVWAVDTWTHVHTIPAHMFTINDICFSPDGTLFATAGRDKHIKLWDAERFTLLKVIDVEKYGGHVNSVNKLFWCTSPNTLISCGDDRTVISWLISKLAN